MTTGNGGGPMDFETIKEIAKRCRRSLSKLMVLHKKNDPFWITSWRANDAAWAAELWNRFEMPAGGHARGLHYKIVSQKEPVLLRSSGMRYLNTVNCWHALTTALRDARYLGMVNADDIVDRRNAEPVVRIHGEGRSADHGVSGGTLNGDFDIEVPSGWDMPDMPDLPKMPDLPEARLGVPQQPLPQIELWIEKSTMDSVLDPIAARHGITTVIGTGETSATRCNQMVDRVMEIYDGRPIRILYISDFDPGGLSMPVAAARKIEFFAQARGLDMQLERIGLTAEQCRQWDLPRTPIKEKEKRKDKFEKRWGRGATELDALEALHPGELGRVVEEAILRFRDGTIDRRTREAAEPIGQKLDEVSAEVHERYSLMIGALRVRYETITAQYTEELLPQYTAMMDDLKARLEEWEHNEFGPWKARVLEVWKDEVEELWSTMAGEIAQEMEPVVANIEWPEPKIKGFDDPLFDSTRDYIDQIDHYKRFQTGDEDEEGE
jgi:hypothetical protein